MKTLYLIFTFLISTLFCFAGKPFKCTIKGIVIGRDSKTLFLKKVSDDDKVGKQAIPIKDKKFEFVFDVKEVQAYELIFEDELNQGSWFPVIFFPIAGQINFKLYPFEQADKDEVIGGQLNKAYAAYKLEENVFNVRQDRINDKKELLRKNNEYYSAAYDSIINIINQTKDHSLLDKSVWLKRDELLKTGEAYTTKGKLLKKENDLLNVEIKKWRYLYINKNQTLLSYYFILQDVRIAKDDPTLLSNIRKVYPKFATIYPSHTYTNEMATIIDGFNKIKAGQLLIDARLPDLNGKLHSLNNLAKNKITLIDFWGSWCGHCIAATRTMLPVYKEFKDKGFVIVGVAKEYKNTNNLKIALKREKYPWLNLVEIDDKNKIWNKYGITNSTGMMLLVDKQGKIVAIDPTADTVKKYLSANL